MIEAALNLLAKASIGGGIAVASYLMYCSGLFSAIAGRITGNGNVNHEERLHKIETNDMHDFDCFKKETKDNILRIDKRLNGLANDVNYIKGQLSVRE